MLYEGGEQHLHPDTPFPHNQSQHTGDVDASTSSFQTIYNYLGLEKASSLVTEAQLAPALKHHEWKIRVQAIRQIERLQEPDYIPLLVTALEDEQPAVRAAVARALGTFHKFVSATPLIAALQDPSWHVRAEAALALGKYQDQVAIESLVAILQDKDEAVRAAAIGALGQPGEQVPIECFVKALYDPVWTVREAAAYALGEQGKRAPITPLLLARSDQDSAVREAVEWALHQTHPEIFDTAPSHTITDSLDLLGHFTNFASENTIHTADTEHEIIPDTIVVNEHDKRKEVVNLSSDYLQTEPSIEGHAISNVSTVHTYAAEQRKSTKTSRRATILRFIERGVAAAIIIAIAMSWLFLNRQITASSTGSLWNVSMTFQQQAPPGATYTRVAWLTTGLQKTSVVIAFDTKGSLHLWNRETGETAEISTGFQHVMAFTKVNGSLFVAYTRPSDSTLQLARVIVTTDMLNARVETLPQLSGLTGPPSLAAWAPDGKRIAVTWNNSKASTAQVQIWDIATQKSVTLLSACSTMLDKNGSLKQLSGVIKALAWTDDSKEISTACTGKDNDHTIETWDAATGQPIKALNSKLAQYRPISVSDEIAALAWSTDNNYLAYLLTDGEIHLLPQSSDQRSDIWLNYGYSNHSQIFGGTLAWSSNGKYLAATTTAIAPVGTVTGWDTMGNQLYTYNGHKQTVYDLVWSPDGKSVASVSKDGTLQIWSTS